MVWIILIVVLISILWLVFSYYNYVSMIKDVEEYANKLKEIQKKEVRTKEVFEKANHLNERINMQTNYPEMYRLSLEYNYNSNKVKSDLSKVFLKAGFLYNVWKI